MTPLIMRFFVHSAAARGRRWLKLQSNEFEPSFIQINQPEVGKRARTPDRTTDKQTDKQTDTPTDNKVRLELSGAARTNNVAHICFISETQ